MRHRLPIAAALTVVAVSMFLLVLDSGRTTGAQDSPAAVEVVTRKIPFREALDAYIKEANRAVFVDASMAGAIGAVEFTMPAGKVLSAEDILLMGLASKRVALIPMGSGEEIVPTALACSRAPMIDVKDLKSAHPNRWYVCILPVHHVDPMVLRTSLAPLMTREGVVVPIGAAKSDGDAGSFRGSLMLVDQACNLVRVVDAAQRMIDAADVEQTAISISVPAGVKAADVESTFAKAAGVKGSVVRDGTLFVGSCPKPDLDAKLVLLNDLLAKLQQPGVR